MIILGKKEAELGKISVRSRANKALEAFDTTDFIKALLENIEQKTLPDPKESFQGIFEGKNVSYMRCNRAYAKLKL